MKIFNIIKCVFLTILIVSMFINYQNVQAKATTAENNIKQSDNIINYGRRNRLERELPQLALILILVITCYFIYTILSKNEKFKELFGEVGSERKEDFINCRNEINPLKTIKLDEDYFKPTNLDKLKDKDPNFNQEIFINHVKNLIIKSTENQIDDIKYIDKKIVNIALKYFSEENRKPEIQIIKFLNYQMVDNNDIILLAIKLKFINEQKKDDNVGESNYKNFKIKLIRNNEIKTEEDENFEWIITEIY